MKKLAILVLCVLCVCGCSLETEGFTSLIGDHRDNPTMLSPDDLQAFDDAAAEWCEHTCGACCPDAYTVVVDAEDPSGGESLGCWWDAKKNTAHMSPEITSSADWFGFALAMLGESCGVPESDRPGDIMYMGSGGGTPTHITAHDVALAKGRCDADQP